MESAAVGHGAIIGMAGATQSETLAMGAGVAPAHGAAVLIIDVTPLEVLATGARVAAAHPAIALTTDATRLATTQRPLVPIPFRGRTHTIVIIGIMAADPTVG